MILTSPSLVARPRAPILFVHMAGMLSPGLAARSPLRGGAGLVLALVWCLSGPLVAQGPAIPSPEMLRAEAPSRTPEDGTATQRFYLSGRDRRDAVPWEFTIDRGRRAGETALLPVPSQWELHGFGTLDYGHDEPLGGERGTYRLTFRPPPDWQGRSIDLVFEGVMTDTAVTLNGESLGPVHQGGFYRFRYPLGDRLRLGEENQLVVTVDEHSADGSINAAEREADYWVFGGIFRPVYLEARPAQAITRLAVDARHDGALEARITLDGLDTPARLETRVETLDGEPVGAPHVLDLSAGEAEVRVLTRVPGVTPWSAEQPRLYRLRLELRRGGQLLHRESRRIGFRTVELRAGEGLFVNGRRTHLEGVNRHAFWPTSGRTLDPDLDRRDVALIRQMNLNAVRTAHYPPDTSFLEACDELGLYVIDELAGWHDAYDTEVGRRLVGEMVERDVNHPSVLLWSNGNEGGWNKALDAVFAEHDPAGRPVIHPDADFGGLDTHHYPDHDELVERLDPDSWLNRWRDLWGIPSPILPTEMLHGLYDGGSGAGLAHFRRLLRDSPRGVGFFLWSFTDESVALDPDGPLAHRLLDSDGNHAPDGILGPFRETTGSFYAIRHLLSPIQIEATFDEVRQRTVRIRNDFVHTDLAQTHLRWAWLDLPETGLLPPSRPRIRHLSGGKIPAPALPPGENGERRLAIPPPPPDADALRLTPIGPTGEPLWTWVLPLRDLRTALAEGPADPAASTDAGIIEPVLFEEMADRLELRTSRTRVLLDRRDGSLLALHQDGRATALRGGGPSHAQTPPHPGEENAPRIHRIELPGARGVRFAFAPGSPLDSIAWTLDADGWLRLDFAYSADAAAPFHGLSFHYPRELMRTFRWLGPGPTRIWNNRRAGGSLGVWSVDSARTTPPHRADEPKLAGYYAAPTWARLETREGTLSLAFATPGIDLGLFEPRFPTDSKAARAVVPAGGIHLLGKVPAIGTKFHWASALAPPGEAGIVVPIAGTVWLRFTSPGDAE